MIQLLGKGKEGIEEERSLLKEKEEQLLTNEHGFEGDE